MVLTAAHKRHIHIGARTFRCIHVHRIFAFLLSSPFGIVRKQVKTAFSEVFFHVVPGSFVIGICTQIPVDTGKLPVHVIPPADMQAYGNFLTHLLLQVVCFFRKRIPVESKILPQVKNRLFKVTLTLEVADHIHIFCRKYFRFKNNGFLFLIDFFFSAGKLSFHLVQKIRFGIRKLLVCFPVRFPVIQMKHGL